MTPPFISRSDLGTRLRRDLSTDDMALAAIDAACEVCRVVAEQTFNLVQGDTITLDGTGTDALTLPELPVVEVGSVLQEDEAQDYTLHDDGVLLKDNGVWRLGRNNIEVTYTHGYETVPSAVRMVALRLAERFYSQPGGVVFQSLGAYQVRYAGEGSDLSIGEKAILRRYKQVRQAWATVVVS